MGFKGTPAIGILVPRGLKRGSPKQELIGQHTQAPVVNATVVVPPLHHLRGQVVEGAAQGAAPAVGRVHGPAKVCDLEVPAQADEQVLRLDVAVDDVLGVAVGQGARQLRDVPTGAGAAGFDSGLDSDLDSELDPAFDSRLGSEIDPGMNSGFDSELDPVIPGLIQS